MIRINLFPYRAAKIKENIRRQVTIYFLSAIFLILVIGYFYLDFTKEIRSLRQEQDSKKKELDSYREVTAKIKKLDKTKADVEIKLNTIKELEKGKTGPVKLLDDIAISIPKDRLWLESLKESKGTLSLSGTAMDNETVADFMNRLESTESITSVELVGTKQKRIKGFDLSLKGFELACKTYAFKPPAPPPETRKRRR